MASDLNRVIIIGRLTSDPTTAKTKTDSVVCKFSIANSRSYRVDGDKKEQTGFYNCVAWAKLGETINTYCRKGQRVAIEGRLNQNKWTTDKGETRTSVDIIIDNIQFLENKKHGEKTDDSAQTHFSDAIPLGDECPF